MVIHRDIIQYHFSNGTTIVDALTFRKCRSLSHISLPQGLENIGDSAFSFCTSLRQICIPASVKFIGVAAFCKSGLELVIFKGIPDLIEPAIFFECNKLKRIIVPKGQKPHFSKVLDIDKKLIIEETNSDIAEAPNLKKTEVQRVKQANSTSLTYNYHSFNWCLGDRVSIDELFSGPISLFGDTSYQFRRKILFIFVKSDIVNNILNQEIEYDIPANTVKFMRKYQEKYSNKIPRILLFICNDGKVASFYDEVKLIRANKNSITIKSLLKS